MPDLFTDLLYGIYLAIALAFIGGVLIGLGLRDWLRIARNEDDTMYVEPEEEEQEDQEPRDIWVIGITEKLETL